MTARALIRERPDGLYEIAWDGKAGKVSSGVLYRTELAAATMAQECHAEDVVNDRWHD